MSRICKNLGDSGKLRFYELDHESKMRLPKTHPHTSNRLAMEPGTCEEKQLKEMQTLQPRAQLDQFSCDYTPNKERRGHDARNRGFGLASCSRGLVLPQGDTTGPKSRGLAFPEGDIADPQMSNKATDGLAPSVFAIFLGAV